MAAAYLLSISTFSAHGQAQAPDTNSEAKALASTHVNIPAGPLRQSILTISRAFGVDVLAPDELIAEKSAPAVSGVTSAAEALDAALAESDLGYASEGDAFVIAQQPLPGSRSKVNDQEQSSGNADDSEVIETIIVLQQRETGYSSTTQSAGTFGEQGVFDTPFSVTVIPQELLLDQQVRGLNDIVRNDPSVVVQGDTGYFGLNIRGFGLNNSTSYRREGLIFQNQQFSMFENKAAVELAKGPTSVRYGFTTPGGVINYVLKRPTKDEYRWIQAFGDSNGSRGLHLDLGGTSGSLGYRVNAVIAEDALFIDDIDGPRRGFSTLLEWKPTEELTIDLDVEYNEREVRAPTRLRLSSFADEVTLEQRQLIINERFDPTTNIGQDYSGRPEDYTILSLGGRYDFNADWAIQGRIARMNGGFTSQTTFLRRGTLQSNGDFTVGQSFSPEPRNPRSFEAFVTGRFNTLGAQHEIAFGAATSRNPLELSLNRTSDTLGQNNIFNPVALPAGNPTSGPPSEILIFNQRAAFASDLITFNDRLRAFGALRWAEQKNEDDFNPARVLETSYEDDAISYNAGVMFDATDKLMMYASRSEGVTQGSQIPADAANSGFDGDGDAFLDPAETEQYEVGIKYNLMDTALLTAAYFDITQPQPGFDDNNFFAYIGDQQHQGFEITASGAITDSVRVIAGGLFLDAALSNPGNPSVDGNRPQNIPETQFNFYIDYEPQFLRGFGVNAGIYYTGDRFADNLETFEVDAYTRLDLGARYEFAVGDQLLTARLNIRNVTDEKFLEAVAFGFFDYGAPLTTVFSISTEF